MSFDAETWLRVRGEKFVANPSPRLPGGISKLAVAADALVTVGALSVERAQAILRDYDGDWVRAYDRGQRWDTDPSTITGDISLDRIATGRVAAIGQELWLAQGRLRLRYALLETDRLTVFVDFEADRRAAGRFRDWIRVPDGMPSGLPAPKLVDEAAVARLMNFNGSGNDDRWSGCFFSDTPIPLGASVFELYGTSIALTPATSAAVMIEPVHSEDVARDHLMRLLALSVGPFADRSVTAASDALVAAGAIARDDPLVVSLQSARRGQVERFPDLPAPWPQLPQEHRDGRDVLIVTGVVTRVFDGHRVAVLAIDSRRDGFVVEVRDRIEAGIPFDVGDRELVWWARDDRGQRYLGERTGYYIGQRETSSEIRFFPPLDPLATELKLLPSTPTAHAVILVRL